MHTTLGEIDEQINDFDSARSQFQTATRLDTNNAEALIGLASSEDRSGHDENLFLELQQAQTMLQISHQKLPKPIQQELRRLLNAKHLVSPSAANGRTSSQSFPEVQSSPCAEIAAQSGFIATQFASYASIGEAIEKPTAAIAESNAVLCVLRNLTARRHSAAVYESPQAIRHLNQYQPSPTRPPHPPYQNCLS
jgi:hypothetical protein